MRRLGLTTGRRSDSQGPAQFDCLLIDTTGELRDWYAIATIVFIGKSLTARGGQNPVEAIVADRPVVFGPHMENFATLSRTLCVKGGALQVNDQSSLTNAIAGLLRNPTARTNLAQRANDVLARHRGATERTAELLENLTPSRIDTNERDS